MNLDVATKLVREDPKRVPQLVNDLCEDGFVQKLTKGQDVIIQHGIMRGTRGKYEGDANNGYVRVRSDGMGIWEVPHIFVFPAEPIK